MTPLETRHAVRTLQAQGRTLREISRLLALSRNTVRRILRHADAAAPEAAPFDAATRDRIEATFARVGGNAVRIQEILAAEHGLVLPYSTLTRWVRQAGLRAPPQRAGSYHFAPGDEMQHDTSPHRVRIGAKIVKAQCASLVLAYSRRLFVHYYPRFTRFECKHFLLEAARFMDGVPMALPPVYEVFERIVDLHGFVSVDTVRYSVPERLVPAKAGLARAGSWCGAA